MLRPPHNALPRKDYYLTHTALLTMLAITRAETLRTQYESTRR